MKTRDFARRVPKAELHLHIEGTLEPELLFALAERNGVTLRWPTVEALRAAYDFTDLQSFLDLYYEGASVLRTGQDFHDLATAYFDRAAADGVRHVELFFDPQTHTARGVAIGTVIEGLASAAREACGRHDLTVGLILCFLRHLSAREAMATLEEALPWRDLLLGVGLDSSEVGHPPGEFVDVFDRARELGLRPVAHAGEEGPSEYIREALDVLRVRRIDHGVRCLDDPGLVERLRRERIPLTVCPLSNVKLRVTPRLEDHPLAAMLERGLVATVNSDDPAYFGGYVGDAFARTADALGLGIPELRRLARNSFEASFLPLEEKLRRIAEVEGFEPEAG